MIDISHLSPEQQNDIREHVAGLSDSDKEFNDIPTDGWHCFHCGAHFTTVKGARLHFGDLPTARPGCDATEELIERCAVAAEAVDREGREWVRDSLWANILRRAGQNVRALKTGALS